MLCNERDDLLIQFREISSRLQKVEDKIYSSWRVARRCCDSYKQTRDAYSARECLAELGAHVKQFRDSQANIQIAMTGIIDDITALESLTTTPIPAVVETAAATAVLEATLNKPVDPMQSEWLPNCGREFSLTESARALWQVRDDLLNQLREISSPLETLENKIYSSWRVVRCFCYLNEQTQNDNRAGECLTKLEAHAELFCNSQSDTHSLLSSIIYNVSALASLTTDATAALLEAALKRGDPVLRDDLEWLRSYGRLTQEPDTRSGL
jgi:hypothetical protein